MSDLGDSDIPDSLDPLSSPPWADQFDFNSDNGVDLDLDPSDVEFSDAHAGVYRDDTSIELDEDEEEDEAEDDEEEDDEDEDLDFDDSDEENGEEVDWLGAEDIGGLDDDLDFFGGVREVVELNFNDAFGDHFHDEDGAFAENLIQQIDAESHYDTIHHILLQHLGHSHQLLLRPHSPMNPSQPADNGAAPGFGAAQRRRGRDQLVHVEMGGQAGAGAGAGAWQGEQDRERRRPPPDIIDLTGDDDADILPRLNAGSSQSGNPRRQRSQPQNGPPRLNRSDNSYMDDRQVIILSSSDDEDQALHAGPRRSVNSNPHQGAHGSRGLFIPAANPHHHHHHHHHHVHQQVDHPSRPQGLHHNLHHNNNNNQPGRGARSARFGDHPRQPGAAGAANGNQEPVPNRISHFSQLMQGLPFFQLINNHNNSPGMAARNDRPDDEVVITAARSAHIGPGAGRQPFVGLAPIHLDYGAHPFAGLQNFVPPAGSGIQPKPQHEPPKPARPGFTRDTGEDVVAICPSCNQELAYDPEGEADAAPATPAKKTARSRKAQAEHHFWAVKACGHVYCKVCFDNRRPTKANKDVGFRVDPGGGKKLFCAVDDCDSEVSTKTAWVGIFM